MTVPLTSVFAFFVAVWWASFVFHLLLHFVGYATKFGRWAERIAGD